MRTMTITATVLAAALGLSACEGMTQTQERVGGGAAIGAGTGALLGGGAEDALLGGALGAGAGYIYDRTQDDEPGL